MIHPAALTNNGIPLKYLFDPEKRKRIHPLIEIINVFLHACEWMPTENASKGFSSIQYYLQLLSEQEIRWDL